mmetsp:Transcript_63259/g.150853  ORF Transcript_63259/g.150853 Transcript_63259/m.150853 type:complete len:223 (-) Transcript_63259:209-877(-)
MEDRRVQLLPPHKLLSSRQPRCAVDVAGHPPFEGRAEARMHVVRRDDVHAPRDDLIGDVVSRCNRDQHGLEPGIDRLCFSRNCVEEVMPDRVLEDHLLDHIERHHRKRLGPLGRREGWEHCRRPAVCNEVRPPRVEREFCDYLGRVESVLLFFEVHDLCVQPCNLERERLPSPLFLLDEVGDPQPSVLSDPCTQPDHVGRLALDKHSVDDRGSARVQPVCAT